MTCHGCRDAEAVTVMVGPNGWRFPTCSRYPCRREGYADARMQLGTAAYTAEVPAAVTP